MKRCFVFAFACLLCAGVAALAAVPPMINYQGKLLKPDGAPVADGTYSMTFAIYAVPTGGTAIWSEPNQTVQVKKGLFSVLLGSTYHLPDNIFDSPDRWFGVTVGTDPEMMPRQQITTAAYAFKAAVADIATTVPDGAITTSKLAPASADSTKVALNCGMVKATAMINVSDIIVDIPGASTTLSVPVNSYILIMATCDIEGATSGTFVGSLLVDGTIQSGQAVYNGGHRLTVSQNWLIPLTAGEHSIKLQAQRAIGTGAASYYQDHTGFTYIIFSQPQ